MSPQPTNSAQHNHSGILKDDFNEIVNWEDLDDSALEDQVFTSITTMNALGQIITSISPDGSVHQPTFNHSGQLKKVEVRLKGASDFSSYVTSIDYNEKGHRNSITYGNGTKTTYEYDSLTYELTRLKTSRPQSLKLLQDLYYVYDSGGNVSWIKDEAQQAIYFDNQVAEAINEYSYDAFYQLKSATGREHDSKNDFGSTMNQVGIPNVLAHKTDGTKMRSYGREYSYDKAGNMLSSNHTPNSSTGFERKFKYSLTNNSLEKSGVGQDEAKWQKYTYDDAWNTEKLAHLDSMSWNYKNELQELRRSDIHAVYQYDSSGERTRKIVYKKKVKKVEVRYYLGDLEIYREYQTGNPEPILERESLHIADDSQRICMVDTKTMLETGAMSVAKMQHLSRYQLGNHLGSASIEIDDQANIISYEEYYPYGSSSFQSVDKTREVPRKRYRYTGMERDEESGLNYHSARYYAPWLCRWLKPDPAGAIDGLNVYRYTKGNPVLYKDPSGNGSQPSLEGIKKWNDLAGMPPMVIVTAEDFYNAISGDPVAEAKVKLVMQAYKMGQLAGYAQIVMHDIDGSQGHENAPAQHVRDLEEQGVVKTERRTHLWDVYYRTKVVLNETPAARALFDAGYGIYYALGKENGIKEHGGWKTSDTINAALFLFGGKIAKFGGGVISKASFFGRQTVMKIKNLVGLAKTPVISVFKGTPAIRKLFLNPDGSVLLKVLYQEVMKDGKYMVRVLNTAGAQFRQNAMAHFVAEARKAGSKTVTIVSDNAVNAVINKFGKRGVLSRGQTAEGWKVVSYKEVPYMGTKKMAGVIEIMRPVDLPGQVGRIVGPALSGSTDQERPRK